MLRPDFAKRTQFQIRNPLRSLPWTVKAASSHIAPRRTKSQRVKVILFQPNRPLESMQVNENQWLA
jgi:hypothetical protein